MEKSKELVKILKNGVPQSFQVFKYRPTKIVYSGKLFI